MTSKTGLCKDFKGDRPCKNYWVDDKHNCFDKNSPLYDEFDKRILLIKLDALGDVVRCTPLAEEKISQIQTYLVNTKKL